MAREKGRRVIIELQNIFNVQSLNFPGRVIEKK